MHSGVRDEVSATHSHIFNGFEFSSLLFFFFIFIVVGNFPINKTGFIEIFADAFLFLAIRIYVRYVHSQLP